MTALIIRSSTPAVVFMAPVVLQSTAELGLGPRPAMMGVSLAAFAAFMTPFSYKANFIVMVQSDWV